MITLLQYKKLSVFELNSTKSENVSNNFTVSIYHVLLSLYKNMLTERPELLHNIKQKSVLFL